MEPTHLEHLRHTLAHLLAQAVMEKHPTAQLTLGPAIEHGFYYDIDFSDAKISEDDLKVFEKGMRKLLPSWTAFTHREVSIDEARQVFAGNPYKLELIEEISTRGESITLYTCGGFTDLCRGGHLENPASEIPSDAFMLDRVAGAYWRGDEKNKMLTRIYGLAFESKEKLDDYLHQREEAEKRDHRKLGKEMNIFTFSDYVGPGLPLWMPNGGAMVEELEKLAKETEFIAGYDRVRTPHIAKAKMYETSGHLPYYEDGMYPPMEYEDEKYYLRAMNCPHHHQVFAATQHSYRDLPIRLAEHGMVYRHEKSGELFGIMRVRALCQNDAHIYCTEEQFADEFRAVNDMYLKYFKIFGVEKYVMRLSLHDPKKLGEKYVNEPELWKKTEDMVRNVLIESNIPYVEVQDEAAFYGPKIDVQVWSAIGREFSLATNQVDFAVPAKFGLTYMDHEGKKQTPLCIHRAPLGTHERFIGFLIEHFAGNFPAWLAPTQVSIIPVKESHEAHAKELTEQLHSMFVRVKYMDASENMGKRIRIAKNMKVPYTIIIGDKDLEAGMITVEKRGEKSGSQMKAEDFIAKLAEEIKNRSLS